MDLTFDLLSEGINDGYFYTRATTNKSGYRIQKIPIFSITSSGDGPCVLIISGFHGDEYEGQFVSRLLIDQFRAQELNLLRGKVIIVPSLNFPACEAGTRFSPYDSGGYNKVSVGSVDGLSAKIFEFYEQYLLKLADICLDLHTGGKSMLYAPLAINYICESAELNEKNNKLVQKFSAPLSMVRYSQSLPCASFEMARKNNCLYLATELGGGTPISTSNIDIGLQGVMNILVENGMLDNKHSKITETKYVVTDVTKDHIFADEDGIFFSYVRPGEAVHKGQMLGKLFSLGKIKADDTHITFAEQDATVVAVRALSETKAGDCLFEFAKEISSPL